jgi:hypothetical protein
MNKWQRDCNGDGAIDCADFAAIHKLGLSSTIRTDRIFKKTYLNPN